MQPQSRGLIRLVITAVLIIVTEFHLSEVQAEAPSHWQRIALEELQNSLRRSEVRTRAKNIIFFLGDGLSTTTSTAARILKGQLEGKPGEESSLVYERFPNVGLVKTYTNDFQVPDSAATATAYFTGLKTNSYIIGMNSRAVNNSCWESRDATATSILTLAQHLGKATGVVTNTRITHATPASLYAQCAMRDWEYDHVIPESERACQKDIARQLVEDAPGRNLRVIMGGGLSFFKPVDAGGKRQDGRDLLQYWLDTHNNASSRAAFVSNRQELAQIQAGPQQVDYLLGLFSPSHMDYMLDRDAASRSDPSVSRGVEQALAGRQPTLSEMTRKSIELLSNDADGYFLLVEGGRIDHAHHENIAAKALHETLEFDRAINVALNMSDATETLIIVTADHSHSFAMNGYPLRGNAILGAAGLSDVDGLPYLTLSYANGPGAINQSPRPDPFVGADPLHDKDHKQQAMVALQDETHGGDDVAIYAVGPWAHLLHTVHEQHFAFYVMAYAACIPIPVIVEQQYAGLLPKLDTLEHCRQQSKQQTKPRKNTPNTVRTEDGFAKTMPGGATILIDKNERLQRPANGPRLGVLSPNFSKGMRHGEHHFNKTANELEIDTKQSGSENMPNNERINDERGPTSLTDQASSRYQTTTAGLMTAVVTLLILFGSRSGVTNINNKMLF